MLQYRPIHPTGKRDPFYNPARDIGNNGIALIRNAICTWNVACPDDLFHDWVTKHNITEDDIANGASLLAKSLRRVISDSFERVYSDDPFFTELASDIRTLILARLGLALLAAVWAGVKDVSLPDSAPPIDVEAFVADCMALLRGNKHNGCCQHMERSCRDTDKQSIE